jgi:5'(3')-deoxyribonucleotidase
MNVILDLDEVLADFVGGMLRLHGVTPSQHRERMQPGEWGVEKALQISANEMWQSIHQNHGFWFSLNKTPWMTKLLDIVNGFDPNWFVVSSPSRCVSSHVGKFHWLKYHFGDSFDRFALTNYKHRFANPSTVLIDDHEPNVDNFRKAGGYAILWPAYHNRDWKIANTGLALQHVMTELTKVQYQMDFEKNGDNNPTRFDLKREDI